MKDEVVVDALLELYDCARFVESFLERLNLISFALSFSPFGVS